MPPSGNIYDSNNAEVPDPFGMQHYMPEDLGNFKANLDDRVLISRYPLKDSLLRKRTWAEVVDEKSDDFRELRKTAIQTPIKSTKDEEENLYEQIQAKKRPHNK